MKPITNAKVAYETIAPLIKDENHEHLVCVSLDQHHNIKSIHIVATGNVESVTLDNKKVCQLAIQDQAEGIILAHNHPSGNDIPSVEDVRLTERLHLALRPLDIALVDHLVITPESYYSFAYEGKLED